MNRIGPGLATAPTVPHWAAGWTIAVTYDPTAAPEHCYRAELWDADWCEVWANRLAVSHGASAREAMASLHAEPMRRAS